jgi:hypothetical protein
MLQFKAPEDTVLVGVARFLIQRRDKRGQTNAETKEKRGDKCQVID